MTDAKMTEQDEVELLQARITVLEEELLRTEASANRAVAEAQEKAYWLDRWRIDLNQIMERNAAHRMLAAGQRARSVYRTLRRITLRSR